MDVFYYWKHMAEDRKAGRIGWFRSANERLAEFHEGRPDHIWVFRTPKGQKGRLQLLARLAWADVATGAVQMPRELSGHAMFYNPVHGRSVWFDGTDADEAVAEVTAWIGRHFPRAIGGNFQGANGQQALRGAPLRELNTLASRFPTRPFLEAAVEADFVPAASELNAS